MTEQPLGRLVLVGCGKMGGALLRRWVEAGVAARIDVVEPNPAGVPEGIAAVADVSDLGLTPAPEMVVVAVKPQAMDAVLPPYGRWAAPGTAFLSIAAGKTIGYFEQRLGAAAAVIRAMPNTPALIGQAATVMAANAHVTAAQRAAAERLMAAVGTVDWVDDEALIDAVTALSGSGPAYVFLLIEALAAAGAKAGLPAELAMTLARQTVAGAGALAAASAEPAAVLRQNVTSPGGTTAAALQILMAPGGLEPLMERAVAAAAARSRELAS